jgi:hypothetical protein
MTTKIPSNVTAKFFIHVGSMTYFMYILVCILNKPEYFKAVAKPVLLKLNYGNTILCFGWP